MIIGAAAQFYESAAQILPVFLLVMMVGEARLGSTGRGSPSELWSRLLAFLGTVGFVLAGEVAALIAVGSGETVLLRGLTCLGIAMGISHLMTQFLFRLLREHKEHFSADAKDRQFRLVLLIAVATLAATYAALSIGLG